MEGDDIGMTKKAPDATEDQQSGSIVFYVKLFDPSPQGVHISKRNLCQIEIIPEQEEIEEDVVKQKKMVEYFVE